MGQLPKSKSRGTVRNQPDRKTIVRQRQLDGKLNKLESLIQSGCSREQTCNILRISESELDAMLQILEQHADREGAPKKRHPNLMSTKKLTASRKCQKCGRQYTRKQGGTKVLCEICYERQQRADSQSVRAVPTAFESNRRRH
jgi:protein-arginine kinase activator protein McsA